MRVTPTKAVEERRPARASLRLRVSLWNAGVIAATLAVLTWAAIQEERSQIVHTEASNATALLEHLSRMPQFQRDVQTVTSHLEMLRESLRASGGAIVLVPLAQSASRDVARSEGRVAAARALSLREGAFELRYLADPDRLDRRMRRSVVIHLLYGLVALAALLGGTEWILRANLLAPLRSLSLQIEHMRDGRGWLSQVSHTDQELAVVARAVADLGPALERQVREWIEAERRAAVATAIRSIRARLQASLSLDAPGAGTQGALHAERERIARALADEETAAFAATAVKAEEER